MLHREYVQEEIEKLELVMRFHLGMFMAQKRFENGSNQKLICL